VAGIAQRLDGLPLAIELAASRVKVLPPEAILERLDHSLALLVSETRDVPDRQRTLRATIAWSHELLGHSARRLLAICSAFRSGIDLMLLDDVAGAMGFDGPLLDVLGELVDHSLLRRVESPAPRFTMLETVREFAAEQLDEDFERAVRAAHAGAMWRMVATLRRPPSTPNAAGLDLLELEHDNLRAALDHCAGTDPLMALRIANRLAGFWAIRGHFSEGRRRLAMLRHQVGDDTAEYADAMAAEAWLATDQGDREAALPLLDRAIEWARAGGEVIREAEALLSRGRAKLVIGDPTGGRADVEASLALQEEFGDAGGLAAALWLGGAAAQADGELGLARERLERSVALGADADQPVTASRAHYLLGSVLFDLGDLDGAEAALAVSVPVVIDLDDRFAIPIALSVLARLAAARGRPRVALRLAGAAAEYEETNQTNRPQFVRALLDDALATVVEQVGHPAAQRLQAEGRTMPVRELIGAGLERRPEEAWQVGVSPPLTAREEEIAVMVAAGLTNREIAERLVLSVRTVETHVARALTKLGFTNRGQLTAWAHHEGLITNVSGERR
jgi:non-specific serine/threonine protein kinase